MTDLSLLNYRCLDKLETISLFTLYIWTGKAQEENEDSDDDEDDDEDEVNGEDIQNELYGKQNSFISYWEYVISIHPCNVSEELASSEDEIDEEGAQYIEKLEKAVSSNWKHNIYIYTVYCGIHAIKCIYSVFSMVRRLISLNYMYVFLE